MKIQVFLLSVLSVFFGGCAFTYEVEVKNYSAKYVKRSDIGSVIGADVNLPLVKDWTVGDFFVIEIYTEKNLLELVTETGSSLFPDLHFCEQPEKEVLLGIHEIYAEGESITSSRLSNRGIERNTHGINGALHKYDVVLFLAWDKERKLPESSRKSGRELYYLKFNLDKQPKDICLSLKGGNLVKTIRSNQVRLTQAEIETVIRESK